MVFRSFVPRAVRQERLDESLMLPRRKLSRVGPHSSHAKTERLAPPKETWDQSAAPCLDELGRNLIRPLQSFPGKAGLSQSRARDRAPEALSQAPCRDGYRQT